MDKNLPVAQSQGPFPTPRPSVRGRYLIRNARAAAAMRMVDFCLELVFRLGTAMPLVPRKILVCNLGQLGDVLLTMPAAAWLMERFPDAEFGFLGGSWSAPVLEDAAAFFRHIHLIDHFMISRRSESKYTKIVRQWRMARAAIREIRAVRYDLVLDFYQFFPSARLTLFQTGIPVRVGWTSGGLSAFYTHRVAWIDAGRHVIDYQRDLLAEVCPNAPPKAGALKPVYLRSLPAAPLPAPLVAGERFVLMHTGTGAVCKEWSDAKWIEAARGLVAKHRVVLAGSGAREVARNAAIQAAVPECVDLTGKADWRQLTSLIEACEIFIGLDSVAGHLAAAFGRKTVVIMTGINNRFQWSPMGEDTTVLTRPTPCAPCNLSNGCGDRVCIDGVEPAMLLSACGVVG